MTSNYYLVSYTDLRNFKKHEKFKTEREAEQRKEELERKGIKLVNIVHFP